jgi:hypothetical protein
MDGPGCDQLGPFLFGFSAIFARKRAIKAIRAGGVCVSTRGGLDLPGEVTIAAIGFWIARY